MQNSLFRHFFVLGVHGAIFSRKNLNQARGDRVDNCQLDWLVFGNNYVKCGSRYHQGRTTETLIRPLFFETLSFIKLLFTFQYVWNKNSLAIDQILVLRNI